MVSLESEVLDSYLVLLIIVMLLTVNIFVHEFSIIYKSCALII